MRTIGKNATSLQREAIIDSISKTSATEAVEVLINVGNEYQRTVVDGGSASTDVYLSSDENEANENPIYALFHGNKGSSTIIYMTNFSLRDFKAVWSTLEGDVDKR